jgi:Tfp pilus assembly pilus retraction ATPase PilT
LINNNWISNMIRKWLLHQIDWAMETWAQDWMYTMWADLERLTKEWKI